MHFLCREEWAKQQGTMAADAFGASVRTMGPLVNVLHPPSTQVQEVQPAILKLARAAYRTTHRISPTVAAKRPASPEPVKPRKQKRLNCFVCNGLGHKASTCPKRATLSTLSTCYACVISAWRTAATGMPSENEEAD